MNSPIKTTCIARQSRIKKNAENPGTNAGLGQIAWTEVNILLNTLKHESFKNRHDKNASLLLIKCYIMFNALKIYERYQR